MKKTLLILSILGTLMSCNKGDDDLDLRSSDFLIFGHFYGMCSGESCVETFKLTENKLFEDTNDEYFNQNFEFVPLENEKFEQVKDLVDFFPEQLLDTDETVFGCPDCADGGGLFIQYSNNGNVTTWRIDQNTDNIPDYLHEFVTEVNEKIQIINN